MAPTPQVMRWLLVLAAEGYGNMGEAEYHMRLMCPDIRESNKAWNKAYALFSSASDLPLFYRALLRLAGKGSHLDIGNVVGIAHHHLAYGTAPFASSL